jgi:hypothetical protein
LSRSEEGGVASSVGEKQQGSGSDSKEEEDAGGDSGEGGDEIVGNRGGEKVVRQSFEVQQALANLSL